MKSPNLPIITIVIPFFNVEKYIENTLLSIIRQTYKHWEILLVNDGATDKSPEIACSLLDKNQVKYTIINMSNVGVGEAHNVGLNNVSTEWFLFVDGDDTIASDLLERYVSVILNHKQIDAVFSDFQYVQEEEIFKLPTYNRGTKLLSSKEIQLFFLLRQPPLLLPGTLIRTDFLKKNHLSFPNLRYSEDISFIWTMLACVEKVAYLRIPMYNYLRRPNSIMTSLKTEQVFPAIPVYKEIQHRYTLLPDADPTCKKLLFPRWAIGMSKAVARGATYSEFNTLNSELNISSYCKQLLFFPDWKIKFLAFIYFISPRLFYFFFKKN